MKKFLIIVCIIAVIIFLGYIGKEMDLDKIGQNNTNTASNSSVITGKNNTANTTKTTNNSNTTNSTTNNVNETKNETENTTNTTNETENKTTNQTESDPEKNKEEAPASDEDKAKQLAINTYGSSDGVYFKVEQVESNGVYIISVRDIETTNALVWYKVNLNNGTVQ